MGRKLANGGRWVWVRYAITILAAAAWVTSWVWLFAFSYTHSYFNYNLCSRVPVFAAALIGAILVPAGAFLVWRRCVSVPAVVIGQVGVSFVSLLPLAATAGLVSRVSGPCHLSGDDAMGAGIDFLMLSGAAAASIVVLAIAGVVRRAHTRQ